MFYNVTIVFEMAPKNIFEINCDSHGMNIGNKLCLLGCDKDRTKISNLMFHIQLIATVS